MTKKEPNPRPPTQPRKDEWHNGGDIEIGQYIRSLRRAARALIATLNTTPSPKTAWDACPILLLYRQAVELQLKMVVGDGNNFLASPVDHITLEKTHSLRWLAQLVCQVIKTVGWDNEFRCEGISDLSKFSALVNELEAVDPVSCSTNLAQQKHDGSAPDKLLPPRVVRLPTRLDALLDLLDSMSDGLAATWDLQQDGVTEDDLVKPTIH
jgi:hypothetical protein